MRKLLLLIFPFFFLQAHAQKKLIRKFLSNEQDTTRKASFMPVPVFGYAQETGFEFGFGAIYAFYTDKGDLLNRSSNLTTHASYSTKKTYNFSFKGDVWSAANRYHFTPEIRLKKMPFRFYGIGNQTTEKQADTLNQHLLKTALDVEKQLFPHGYTGISLSFEDYLIKDKEPGGIYTSLSPETARAHTRLLYLGISQSIDTRNSNNYPSKGFFGRISYQYAPPIFGAAYFSGSQLKLNIRNFYPLSSKMVLGWQALYHTVQGRHIPFYLLPQLGNDEMMRGYYNGRFRDKNLLAAQIELRYRPLNRFGFVVFAGGGKVFANNAFNLQGFKPDYGIGGRYFFDPAKGLSVRVDYGIGEKRPSEKRQKGLYISLAEAF